MAKQNCWEFTKCGREPNGINAEKCGVCPISTFQMTNGFCEGQNAGRACAYISKILDKDCTEVRIIIV